jgi:hypothetical protein
LTLEGTRNRLFIQNNVHSKKGHFVFRGPYKISGSNFITRQCVKNVNSQCLGLYIVWKLSYNVEPNKTHQFDRYFNKFAVKSRRDPETGFASHEIGFNPNRSPSVLIFNFYFYWTDYWLLFDGARCQTNRKASTSINSNRHILSDYGELDF